MTDNVTGSQPTISENFDITREHFKLIAMITMLIDHIGLLLLPQYTVFRIIGRLAMPLYVYLVVTGISRTRSKKRYFIRLLILAIISQIPYMVINPGKANIIFCLAALVPVFHLWQGKRYRTALLLTTILTAIPMDYGFWYVFVLALAFNVGGVKALLLIGISTMTYCVVNDTDLQSWALMVIVLLVFIQNVALSILPNIKINNLIYRAFYPAHLVLLIAVKLMFN